MKLHAVGVDERGDSPHLLHRIERTELRSLRNIDGAGLRMVAVTEVLQMGTKQVGRQFAVGRGDRDERNTPSFAPERYTHPRRYVP